MDIEDRHGLTGGEGNCASLKFTAGGRGFQGSDCRRAKPGGGGTRTLSPAPQTSMKSCSKTRELKRIGHFYLTSSSSAIVSPSLSTRMRPS